MGFGSKASIQMLASKRRVAIQFGLHIINCELGEIVLSVWIQMHLCTIISSYRKPKNVHIIYKSNSGGKAITILKIPILYAYTNT